MPPVPLKSRNPNRIATCFGTVVGENGKFNWLFETLPVLRFAMVSTALRRRSRALRVWAALMYWTGKAAGSLVAVKADADGPRAATTDRCEFARAEWAAGWARWAKARAWNAACLAAVAHRICAETWPVTVQAATRLPRASCYDTVCGGAWYVRCA